MHNCFQLYVWTPDPFNQMKKVLESELCSVDETFSATKLMNISTMVVFAVARRLVKLTCTAVFSFLPFYCT